MCEDFLFAVGVIAFIFIMLATTGQIEVLGLFSPPLYFEQEIVMYQFKDAADLANKIQEHITNRLLKIKDENNE